MDIAFLVLIILIVVWGIVVWIITFGEPLLRAYRKEKRRVKVLKLWDLALELEKHKGKRVKNCLDVIEYGLEKGDDVIIFKDAEIEGEKTEGIQFFIKSHGVARMIKEDVDSWGFKSYITGYCTKKGKVIPILNIIGDVEKIKDAFSLSKVNPYYVAISEILP